MSIIIGSLIFGHRAIAVQATNSPMNCVTVSFVKNKEESSEIISYVRLYKAKKKPDAFLRGTWHVVVFFLQNFCSFTVSETRFKSILSVQNANIPISTFFFSQKRPFSERRE